MRILHVIPSYQPARRYGGPVFATHALCAALARQGCDVTVFTTNVDGPGESPVAVGVPVVMDSVNVWYFDSPWLRRLYYAPAMARALAENCSGFDILHLHSVFLWPTWAAARAARRCGVPYLLAPRGMLVRDLIARKSRWAKRAWIELIERRNLEAAAGIHVTSQVEAVELRRHGFVLPPLHEVPNGVGGEEQNGSDEALPATVVAALNSGRPVILSLGRINWKKGLDRLIPALAQIPDAQLLIVGNDEEGYTPSLLELAKRERVFERVVFAGPVFGKAKTELYRRATVFALASYSENFGNVILEAMAEGCPVVVTPEVGASAIVEELGGGVVVGGDPQQFARAVRHLLADEQLRADMGRRGREGVRARYTWDKVAERMLEAYRSTIAAATLMLPTDSPVSSIPVTVMIFTLNEEMHLPKCFQSLAWCDDVIVVDSFSHDRTEEICRSMGGRFFQHPFTGFGDQRNWALENTAPKHEWVLILDTDERVPPDLALELAVTLPNVPQSVAGFRLKRRFFMWGRWLRYSSLYPSWVVRLVRKGRVRYINRGHAETQDVIGDVHNLKSDLIDENLKGIDEWFDRQNRYARKEAEYESEVDSQPLRLRDVVSANPLVRRKAMKRLAMRSPARPFVYFLYSYLWRRGFLDGKDGLVFCMMRALYQGMVAAKKHDLQRRADR